MLTDNSVLELIENENMQDIELALKIEASNSYVRLVDHKLSLTPVEWALLHKLVESGIPCLENEFSCKKVEMILDQIKQINDLEET